MSKPGYVYIVECSDQSLYTGWTTDVRQRVNTHNAGQGAKYTRGRRPVQLVYQEECKNRQQAMSREHEIKQLDRSEKLALIAQANQKNKDTTE